jgi:hypothetical protein
MPHGAEEGYFLAATGQNLRKLAKLIPMSQPAPAGGGDQPTTSSPSPNDNLRKSDI